MPDGKISYYLENGPGDLEKAGEDDIHKVRNVLFPHYMLMSACIDVSIDKAINKIEILEQKGLFPPWGLVENFNTDLSESLAMIGSLNASFETISAYHLLCKKEGKKDVIYEAARKFRITQ